MSNLHFFPKITEACLNFRFQFVTLYQNSWRDCSIPWKTIIESFKNHKNTITAFTKNVSLETKPMGTSTLDQVRKKGYFLKDRFREWRKVFKQLLLSDYCEIKRPYPPNQYYQLTVWNSQNFSAIKILREISFDGFKNVKKLEMLKFHHFLTLRFYVKSIFGILEVQNLLFQHI